MNVLELTPNDFLPNQRISLKAVKNHYQPFLFFQDFVYIFIKEIGAIYILQNKYDGPKGLFFAP